MANEPETRTRILEAAKASLLQVGYARLSTRVIAETAGVPLSQIHYHFGSKQKLVLELLEQENRRLLGRQAAMFGSDMPVWKQWVQACDFLDDDLESGYVRVLQEMVAAGWSDPEIARTVGQDIRGWFDLLADVARRAEERFGSLGPFTPEEVAALAGLPFLGAETVILLGLDDTVIAARSALRRIGDVLRTLEDGEDDEKEDGNSAGHRRRR
ncbi:MAG TPA: TetR/AcrR family transcriptional regulator [Acidimicrobiales bacterium]|nr:TetR/AcrR family transcriptional regulator [Acidimicrobiales bacterium]